MLNATNYFKEICNTLKETKSDQFHFCRVTGLDYLEDVLAKVKSKNAFFAVDDSDDGVTTCNSGGYFERKSVVVYLLKKYDVKDLLDREVKLNEVRSIYRKILSKLIIDKKNVSALYYLDTNIYYHEVPGFFAAGTCGLYFIISYSEAVELIYNATDWENTEEP